MRSSSGTNSSRGTRSIAASTRSSSMPRARSWWSTIARRSDDAGTGEVREHSWSDIGDALDRRIDTDGEHRHDGVAFDERAVAAPARMMASADIDELPSLRGGDQQLAGVRIGERGPRAVERVRVVEDRHITGRLPSVRHATK